MKDLVASLNQALSDGEHISMSRLLALIASICTIFLPAIAWFSLSLFSGKLLDVPTGFVSFMAAANALTLAMFAANKRQEQP